MNNKPLKVLFISSWYPTRAKPLNGIFVQRHAEAVARYCQIALVFASSDEIPGIEIKTENNIQTIRTYYKKNNSAILFLRVLSGLPNYISAWRKAIKLYQKENGKPDIIHANIVLPASFIAVWYSLIWKVPYIITEHWTGYFPEDGRYKSFPLKILFSLAIRRASAIIAVSEILKNKMLELKLFNNYYLVSNVVDTSIFTISPKKQIGGIKFIHVSLPDEKRKNIPGILRAFHTFNKFRGDSTLTLVVGNGPSINSLKELCNDLELKDKVHFSGWKFKEELAQLLQASDAFILFSNFETQGIVLLEAMSCGLPVISSKCGAPEEFITPGSGLLVNKGDELQLAEAMEIFAKNKDTYKPEEIRNSIIDMVNEKKIAQKIVNIYNTILKR